MFTKCKSSFTSCALEKQFPHKENVTVFDGRDATPQQALWAGLARFDGFDDAFFSMYLWLIGNILPVPLKFFEFSISVEILAAYDKRGFCSCEEESAMAKKQVRLDIERWFKKTEGNKFASLEATLARNYD